MGDLYSLLSAGAAIAAVVYFLRWRSSPLRSIPTVGGTDLPFLSYLSAFVFMIKCKEYVEQGYKRYYGSTFKVPMLDNWMVVVSGPKLVDELRRRPDDELSFVEAIADIIQTKYTLGPEPEQDPYHVDIIREKLTRSLPLLLPEVVDELKLAVPEHIPVTEKEWVSVDVMKTTQRIIARASSRVFVGMPTCRDKEYLDLAVAFTIEVIKDKTIINFFPNFMKPLIGHLINNVSTAIKKTVKHLQPAIDERRAKMKEFGEDWPDKPHDMLQWVMEVAESRDNSYEAIAQRIMLVNFAAIHTSSNSITHAIYHLAEHPEFIAPLREEIEDIIKEEGWTKAAMGKMWKLDSFFRESQRFNGINLMSVTRKAIKDVTLQNGTVIPRGTLVVAAAYPTHHDESVYANPEVFDPFRFARLREEDGEGTRHQFVNTSVEYIPFGHGKHACPGRFFAANELKAMLAYMVLNYDLKLPDDAPPPKNIYWATNVIPAVNGKVMFRKRQRAE
ncbi:cytochrome P450 [Pilatotrama ljubarskyi]|nr:cytochrome P450 [Pilatotrama ljubarskyi]